TAQITVRNGDGGTPSNGVPFNVLPPPSSTTTSATATTSTSSTGTTSSVTGSSTSQTSSSTSSSTTSQTGTSTTTPPPPPNITAITPTSATAGGPWFALEAAGTGFGPNSTVRWNGNPRGSTFVSPTHLTASIPPSDITAPPTAQITVRNGDGPASNS